MLITVLEGRVASFVYLMHVGELFSLFYNGACLDLIVPGRSQNVIFVFWKVWRRTNVLKINMFEKVHLSMYRKWKRVSGLVRLLPKYLLML